MAPEKVVERMGMMVNIDLGADAKLVLRYQVGRHTNEGGLKHGN